MICDLCGKNYGRQGGSFNKHLIKHNIDSYVNYIIISKYNNIRPLCKCGCGKETTLVGINFKDYFHGHNAIDFHNENNKLKPNNTIIDMYLSGISGLKISKLLKLDRTYIYSVLRYNNILKNMSETKRKYKINESIFEKINTEEKAYWLGFLFADGYNHIKKSTVTLSLSDIDFIMLEKFKFFLQTDKPIRKNSEGSHKVVIENKKISSDLKNKGVIQKKTHKLEFPEFLNISLERHFIRGYFDGDGCVTYGKLLNAYSSVSIVSCKKFLDELKKRIDVNFSYNKRHKDRNDEILTLSTGGIKNIMKIYDYFYKDGGVFMPRKKEKFEKWFKWYFENLKSHKKTIELKNNLKI